MWRKLRRLAEGRAMAMLRTESTFPARIQAPILAFSAAAVGVPPAQVTPYSIGGNR